MHLIKPWVSRTAHRWSVRAIVLLTTSSVALFGVADADAAVERPKPVPGGAQEVARSIVDVAPAGSTAALGGRLVEVEHDARLPSGISAGGFELPGRGRRTLTSTSTRIGVGMPDTVRVGAPRVSEEGLTVYPASRRGDVTAAVAVGPGSASIQVVIPGRGSPTRYEYPISRARPRLEADGSVTLMSPASSPATPTGRVVAVMQPAWAIDANGQHVPTRYEVTETSVVQIVDLDAATAFPVVADPDLIFFAKCAGAIVQFAAENGFPLTKFWRGFKSVRVLIKVFRRLKGMRLRTKIRYVTHRLGYQVGQLSGIPDLVQRCTP